MSIEYSYTDENGDELFQCVRREPKGFHQRHREGDVWVNNLQGIRRVLYHLPDLTADIEAGRTIYVVEGEKDVDNMRLNGYAATCSPMGAGRWDKVEGAGALLATAKHVVVVADDDEPGYAHAAQIAASIVNAGGAMPDVVLPTIGKDASDALELAGDNLFMPIDMEPIEPEPVDDPLEPFMIDWAEFWANDTQGDDWLVEPLIARGRAHAMYAGAKTGKSYLILAVCAALATGRAFLDMPAGDPVDVLYMDYEMTAEDIRARLEEFGYGPDDDLSHLHYVLLPSIPPLDTFDGGQAVLTSALAHGCELVVIDTTGRALEGDENDNDAIRAFYRYTGGPLKAAAIAWIRLDHAGKDTAKGQRGASAKNDDVDIVMQLTGTDNGMKVKATHRRMSWFPELLNITTTKAADGVVAFSTAERGTPSGTQALVQALDDLNAPIDWGRDRLKKEFADQVGPFQNTVWTAAIKHRKTVAEVEASEALGQSGDGVNESVFMRADSTADSADSSIRPLADDLSAVSVSLDTDSGESAGPKAGQISAFDEVDEEWAA